MQPRSPSTRGWPACPRGAHGGDGHLPADRLRDQPPPRGGRRPAGAPNASAALYPALPTRFNADLGYKRVKFDILEWTYICAKSSTPDPQRH